MGVPCGIALFAGVSMATTRLVCCDEWLKQHSSTGQGRHQHQCRLEATILHTTMTPDIVSGRVGMSSCERQKHCVVLPMMRHAVLCKGKKRGLTYGQELLYRAPRSRGAGRAKGHVGDWGGAGGCHHGGLMAAVQQVPHLQHTISPCHIYHSCVQAC